MINTHISLLICIFASLMPLVETPFVLKRRSLKPTSLSLVLIIFFALLLSGLHFSIGWWLINLINKAAGFYQLKLFACLISIFAFHLGILISFYAVRVKPLGITSKDHIHHTKENKVVKK